MNNTPRRTLRDRFIRGAIVASKRGDDASSIMAMDLAIRHNRAYVVETARNDNPVSVTCHGMESKQHTSRREPQVRIGITHMARLFGTTEADWVVGSAEADFVSAGAGDDIIRTFAVADLAAGQTDARNAAADASDTAWAGIGNDAIETGGSNDMIYAEAGDDVIDAGTGNDRMFGMQGADIFRFKWEMTSPGLEDVSGGTGAGNRDYIGDFRQGEDRIDLTGWQNAVDGVMGFQFTYWGVISHGMQAEATYRHEGANTVVVVGFEDKVTEIELAGTHWLNEGDFIFG